MYLFPRSPWEHLVVFPAGDEILSYGLWFCLIQLLLSLHSLHHRGENLPADDAVLAVSIVLIDCTFWVGMSGYLLTWVMAECQVIKHPEGFDILHLPLGQQTLAFHISTRQNFKPFTEAEFSKTLNPLAWQNWQYFYTHYSLSLFIWNCIYPLAWPKLWMYKSIETESLGLIKANRRHHNGSEAPLQASTALLSYKIN